jgi:DNA polymerase III sliding clamp (beta) subunit (PCNA family)
MNTVLAENLYKSLKEVKRTTIHSLPVLNHAKLEFSNGELLVTTTDLEKPITAKCAARVESEWSTCVPMVHKCEVITGYTCGRGEITAKHKLYPFLDYIKVMAEYKEVLELEFLPDIQILVIHCGKSRSEFKCIDAMEFPAC